MRTVVKLAVFLLVVHALYRFVPVYFHYQQFKDAVHETAMFSKDKTDVQIIDRVMELAEKYRVPVKREYVEVKRGNEQLLINAAYVDSIEWLPRYRKPWLFEVGEHTFTNVRPASARDLGR
jgi:hypothetical protein